MSRVLIVGGGTGGIAAANELRKALPRRHKVTLIERSPTYLVGATKPWVMLGEKSAEEIARPVDRLKKRGIEVLRTTVQRIDPSAVSVTTQDGEVRGDFMIIALGADYDMGAVPGLKESAQEFYTLNGSVKLRDTLRQFDGGDLAILIPRAPFKCPPAPYEAAMLIHSHFRKWGILGKTRMSLYTLEGAPMATAGPEVGKFMRGMLEERGIVYHPLKRAARVDSGKRTVAFEDGSEAKYDLLISVPPHVAPAAVKESGLVNQSGWIPADSKNLQLKGLTDSGKTYVIGDVSVVALPGRFKPENPLVLPKAGTIADAEARVASAHIAARISGKESTAAFDGRGFCYIETGDRHAVRGEGSFYEMPNPTMRHAAPDMIQYEDKLKWVNDWLNSNLG